MSFRYGNREQITLFPQSVEEYVKDSDPVRAYDAIVESFDFYQLGIDALKYSIYMRTRQWRKD